MKYRILDIKDVNTNESRKDKFYPSLVNQIIDVVYGLPEVDGFLFGIINEMPIRTSRVQSVSQYNKRVIVTTTNTIYILEQEEKQ